MRLRNPLNFYKFLPCLYMYFFLYFSLTIQIKFHEVANFPYFLTNIFLIHYPYKQNLRKLQNTLFYTAKCNCYNLLGALLKIKKSHLETKFLKKTNLLKQHQKFYINLEGKSSHLQSWTKYLEQNREIH